MDLWVAQICKNRKNKRFIDLAELNDKKWFLQSDFNQDVYAHNISSNKNYEKYTATFP